MAVLKPSGVEVMDVSSLAASATTALGDCDPTDLTKATELCFTIVCTFNASATAGARVTLWPAYDGTNFDSAAWDGWYWDIDVSAGNTVTRTTPALSTVPKSMKIKVENRDSSYAITSLKAYAIKQSAG